MSAVLFEQIESRILYAVATPTPPAPLTPPAPGVTLDKGVLSVVADPKGTNAITVNLSKDGKSVCVNYDGKASNYKVTDVADVKVLGATKSDKVTVDLSGLAPKGPPPKGAPQPPPPPPAGVNLKDGLLTIAGDPKTANTVAVTASKDGKSISVNLDGKTSVFSATSVSDITVFDGGKPDSVTVDLGSVKLKHPVLVHGAFAADTTIGGGVVYDLMIVPPKPQTTGGTDNT